MVTSNGLLRVFWPNEQYRSPSPGVIVGWRNSGLDLFVISILEEVEPRSVDIALKAGYLFRHSPHPIARIFQLCGQNSMQVLGTVNREKDYGGTAPGWITAFTDPGSPFPRIHCLDDAGGSIQVILFDRPLADKMQYISLTPISLELADLMRYGSVASQDTENIDLDAERERRRIEKLVEKLKLHTIVRYTSSPNEVALPKILNQVNCSDELHRLVQSNVGLVGIRPKRTMSVSERVVESATSIWSFILMFLQDLATIYAYPVLSRVFIVGLTVHRIAAEMILQILEWRPPTPLKDPLVDKPRPRAALKDVSAFCQQIDIRLQQFCYWPIQYVTLQHRKADWSSIPTSHAEYIRFYNSLWLVANDVIIGIALGSYIIDNADTASTQISHFLNSYTITGLQRMITWLMDWPAGLKLNNELAAFLGDLFLWVIEYWSFIMNAFITPFLPRIMYFIGYSSFAGASLPIALFSDLLSILTLHIYSFYIASARIFNWQLTIIASLFHLFRGKKRNVLRNRIDSCDYDLDQLLLGTILFTLLFFLLPTVIVFYLTFASARMAIITSKAVLDTFLACLNHFPLFALMLRIKDSRRLPGGVQFSLHIPGEAQKSRSAEEGDLDLQDLEMSTTAYITLSSSPLPMRTIFHQYFQLAHRIRKHYLSPFVVLCLITGKFVPPIQRREMYSLQYSMLPAQRATVGEVWQKLVEERGAEVNGYANAHTAENGGRVKRKGKRWKS